LRTIASINYIASVSIREGIDGVHQKFPSKRINLLCLTDN
jgi:hypothetical protein